MNFKTEQRAKKERKGSWNPVVDKCVQIQNAFFKNTTPVARYERVCTRLNVRPEGLSVSENIPGAPFVQHTSIHFYTLTKTERR